MLSKMRGMAAQWVGFTSGDGERAGGGCAQSANLALTLTLEFALFRQILPLLINGRYAVRLAAGTGKIGSAGNYDLVAAWRGSPPVSSVNGSGA